MTNQQLPKPRGSDPLADNRRFALRFISGKYQGGEFPLGEGQEIVIGRSSDLDMVLVEEMVSRRHARIRLAGGVIGIEDLGSTNGTFVNGEKVEKSTLHEGDRVLIGTNILKVVAVPLGAAQKLEPRGAGEGRGTARTRMTVADEAPRMSGSLEEIPLPDLLQLLGTSRKNGVLSLRTDTREGRIFLSEGRVRYALLEGADSVAPLKAVYRMLSWQKGVFELDPPEAREFETPLDASAQEILMEGFRQQDELGQLRARLPPLETRLALKVPLSSHLRELAPEELDMLEHALTAATLEAVFDIASGTDLEIGKALLSLIQRGYLHAAG